MLHIQLVCINFDTLTFFPFWLSRTNKMLITIHRGSKFEHTRFNVKDSGSKSKHKWFKIKHKWFKIKHKGFKLNIGSKLKGIAQEKKVRL